MTSVGIEVGPANRVVLVHGAPDRATSFRKLPPLLPDFDVITYDRRGYGGTPLAHGLGDHASDLLEIIGDTPAAVVGHSFGANVAVAAAIRKPGLITSLGLWEPPVPWLPWCSAAIRDGVEAMAAAPDPERLADAVFRRMFGKEFWFALPEETRAAWRADGAAMRADMASQLSPPFDYSDLTTPTVVGCGTATWDYQIPSARHLAALLRAPLVELAGADHFAHANQPELFAGFVRRSTVHYR